MDDDDDACPFLSDFPTLWDFGADSFCILIFVRRAIFFIIIIIIGDVVLAAVRHQLLVYFYFLIFYFKAALRPIRFLFCFLSPLVGHLGVHLSLRRPFAALQPSSLIGRSRRSWRRAGQSQVKSRDALKLRLALILGRGVYFYLMKICMLNA